MEKAFMGCLSSGVDEGAAWGRRQLAGRAVPAVARAAGQALEVALEEVEAVVEERGVAVVEAPHLGGALPQPGAGFGQFGEAVGEEIEGDGLGRHAEPGAGLAPEGGAEVGLVLGGAGGAAVPSQGGAQGVVV